MDKIENFRSKVANNPDNLLFRFSLGQALYEAGRSSEAVEHLERCAASRDDWMLPRILLGKALLDRGQPERARPILEAALELAVAQHHDDPAAELRDLLSD
ncbi:MAG: tetratricopeptide repeat protein [Opitutales bacterium]